MTTINLELTEESAREMLPILERQKACLLTKVETLAKQINQIRAGIGLQKYHSILQPPDFVSAPSFDPPQASELLKVPKTPHGRIKKGQSKKVIVDFLKKRN